MGLSHGSAHWWARSAAARLIGWEYGVAEFRLFGPVEVSVGGRHVDAGQPRQRVLLAALLIDAGRPVTVDTLLNRVWGDVAPERARHAVHTYVTRIRKLLAQLGDDRPEVLVRRSDSYTLDIDPAQVDLHRFRRLLRQARDPELPDPDRLALLGQALALWRGEPLAGLSGPWPDRIRDLYRGERLTAVVRWAQAELRAGDPGAVVEPVSELVGEHPLVEPLTAVLMQALHATGRTAEALDWYTSVRKRLVQELGTEPGAELRGVHQAILRGEVDPTASSVAVGRHRPAQLPVGVRGFAGRESELARLDAVLAGADRHPTAVVISAVSGTAGVGKTALAVHWAHRVADRFPDGQLYVNLRGFDPSDSPLSPAEAIRGFLEALEVPPQRVPADGEAQISLYRTLLSGRRVLVVLDNARDADQVRPLLPGGPTAFVLVTSRSVLSGLVAAEGADSIRLELLTPTEARELLAGRLGAYRVTAEPDAVDEIVAQCAGLPLALAIVASRAATHPQFMLAALAAELREARGGLRAFESADAVTDLRAVFSWSYHALSAGAARLFRLLALHPGPSIATSVAASGAGLPVRQVRPLLAELTGTHLLSEHVPGRFVFHDLLHTYATELAHTVDSDQERNAAVERMLDHYLATAAAAMDTLYPQERHRRPRVSRPAELPVRVDFDAADATAWLGAEHANLLAAATYGTPEHTWRLAATLSRYLYTGAHYKDALEIHAHALRAARETGDRQAQGIASVNLGHVELAAGRSDEAKRHLEEALATFRGIGDRAGTGRALHHLGVVHRVHSRYAEACEHFKQALAIFGELHDPLGESNALGALSEAYAEWGNYAQARDQLNRALATSRDIGDRMGVANALGSLGEVYRRWGNPEEACTHFQQALVIFRELGYPRAEARTLNGLGGSLRAAGRAGEAMAHYRSALAVAREAGDPYEQASALDLIARSLHASGDHEEARQHWNEALKIYTELNIPEAQEVRRHLAALELEDT
jgi:DNA-binding SARP family transcriptional activator/Tfp pilus assembly protein PilF